MRRVALMAAMALACGEVPALSPHFEVRVAPLALEGVADACYDLRVVNGADEVV